MALKDKLLYPILKTFPDSTIAKYAAKSIFSNLPKPEKIGSSYFYPVFGIGGNVNWLSNDHKELISEGFNKTIDLYAVIKYIVESAVNVPFGLYEYDIKGNKKKLSDEHKFMEALKYPNQFDSGKEFRSKYLAYYLVLGNSFINRLLPVGFSIPQLYVLPAQHMTIYTKDNTFYDDFRFNDITGYELNFGKRVPFDTENIWHKRDINLNFENGEYLFGMSPLIPGSRTITALRYNDEAKAGIMKNHGAGGLISNNSDQVELSSQHPEIERIQREYKEMYGFSDNQYKVIITAAKLKYQQMSLPIDKLQLIENAKEDFRKFCRAYNFSPVLLGDDGTTAFNNILSAEKRFYTGNLMTLVNEMYADLTEFVIGKKSNIKYEAEWNKVHVLQDDLKEKSLRLTNEVSKGIITPRQAQMQMGYEYSDNPAPDEYYISSNLVKVNQTLNEPPKPNQE